MSDDEEMVMLSGRVPKWMKQLVNADERDNQEVLRVALREEYGGEKYSELQQRYQEKERRENVVEDELSEREQELETIRQEKEALKTRLEQQEAKHKAQLNQTLEKLESVPWQPDNPAIQTNAEELDMTPEALINELEDYHAE